MEGDWDDSSSQTPTSFGRGRGGFGSSNSNANSNGMGRGIGRGVLRAGFTVEPAVNGSSESENQGRGFGGGGFGKGRGGFGSKQNTDFKDNGGNENEENNNSFGGKRNGFGGGRGGGGGFGGSRGVFGGGGRGGFSGGSGEGRSGGGACYKCQETGHMARDCPNAESRGGGGGGGNACFKCQETGHMARDCPNAESRGGGGGGGNACFKCQETGHMARDCPNAEARGGGGGGGNACFKCQETGHMARDCPNAGSRGGGGGGGACFKCQETGHMARDCPNADSRGGGGGSTCYKCQHTGHFARECPNAGANDGGFNGDRPPRGGGFGRGGGRPGGFGNSNGDDEEGGGHKVGELGTKPVVYIPPAPSENEEEIFKDFEKGINFNKYEKIPVEVTGSEAPPCINSFDEAGLYEGIYNNVKRSHYDKPTPVQKYAIPIILAGRDVMACAQTGSGKTAAFLLPVLTGMLKNGLTGSQFSEVQEPQALVVAPTRELVSQIYTNARKFAHGTMLRPVVLYGGTSVSYQIRQVENGAHIVIGTPGRLLDIIGKGKISLKKLKYLILDEADRMLDMGFGPDIKKLVYELGTPPKEERQTLLFSATFPSEIQNMAAEYLNDYLFLTVGRVGGACSDVTQNFFEVDRLEKRKKLCDILTESGSDKTLVFVEQKRNADFLASFLSESGFPTTSIHGDREQREREEALLDFKTGKAPILIATSVAARGLDIPLVKHVINYDLPSSIDEYVHRIGRTGRLGNLGKATSFYTNDTDAQLAKPLLKILVDAQQIVPEWLETYAQNAMPGGGGNYRGGKFGGRDIRKDQPRTREMAGDGADTYSGYGSGIGGQVATVGGAADEEEWD